MAQLDNIAASFNGVQTTFTLAVSGTPVTIPTPRDLDISIGGVVQYEGTDFTVSGSDITFNTAPLAGDLFAGEYLEVATLEASLTSQINTKADQTSLDSTNADVATKADDAATTASLNLKADQTSLDSTNAAVSTKADDTATTAALALKADQTDLDATDAEVATKADDTATTAALALKADQTSLDATDAAVATKADDTATTAALALKADQADLDVTNTAVATKADSTATTAALALKADQTSLDATDAEVATKADDTATTAALALKADQTSLDTTNTLVATKLNTADLPSDVSAFTNDSDYATNTEVSAAVAAIVDSAPSTLDTLNELAASLGDDPNFATTVSNQIGLKADQTSLDATNTAVSTKADQTSLDTTNAAVATKADDTATTAALALKADQSDLDTTDAAVATKADATATTAALALKANQSDLDATDAEVATKADDTATTAALALKADQADLDTTDANVATKADATATTAALALKADQADLDTTDAAVATKADDAATTAALALKADQSSLDATDAEVATKADDTATTAALALKADQADLNTTDAEVATKADATATTAALALKADQADLDTTNANVATKADDTATTAALALKADQADLDTTNATVANKLNTADLPSDVSAFTNDSDYATNTEVAAAVAAVVDSAPATLDTLNELAASLGDDPNFATTVSSQIGLKADTTALTAGLDTKFDKTGGSISGDITAAGNLTLNGTGSVKVPSGTTAERDASPVEGMLRYNSTNVEFEGYINGAWGAIGASDDGNADLNIDTMTGDGTTTALSLSVVPSVANNTQVYVDGVYQNKDTYSVVGTTLTFSAAPPIGAAVEVMTMTPTTLNVSGDGTITPAKIASGDFYFDTNTLYVDSTNNRVGVGTTSPSRPLTVNGFAHFGSTDCGVTAGDNGGVASVYGLTAEGTTYKPFEIRTGAAGTGFYQTTSGNVGIGTTSPSGAYAQPSLHIHASGNGAELHLTDGTTGATSSDGMSIFQYANDGYIHMRENGSLRTYINDSERMRIDASGNLLVGTTDTDLGYTDGDSGVVFNPDGYIQAARDSAFSVLYLNKLNNDGTIIQMHKDGSTVGTIGVQSSNTLFIAGSSSQNTGVRFFNTGVAPCNSSGDYVDNSRDLGASSVRWDDVYATNGTIQTSDRNEKQDIAELSDAEQRVAVACKGLLRKFRWKDSVAEKGDDARIHFGIMAQDLQSAFEAEGLDAGDYAMFISNTWTDEETNEEKTRLGVRYPELLAFIISAI